MQDFKLPIKGWELLFKRQVTPMCPHRFRASASQYAVRSWEKYDPTWGRSGPRWHARSERYGCRLRFSDPGVTVDFGRAAPPKVQKPFPCNPLAQERDAAAQTATYPAGTTILDPCTRGPGAQGLLPIAGAVQHVHFPRSPNVAGTTYLQ